MVEGVHSLQPSSGKGGIMSLMTLHKAYHENILKGFSPPKGVCGLFIIFFSLKSIAGLTE